MPEVVTTGYPFQIIQQGEPTIPTVTGMTAESSGAGHHRTVVITFANTPLPLIDNAAVIAYGGLKVLDLPEGAIAFEGAVVALAVTKSSAGVNTDWDGDFGVGTATAAADATLSATEQNIIPTTATPQAVAGATTAKGVATAGLFVDGTTTPVDVYLNFLVDDVDHNVAGTACNLILNGTLTLHYLFQGNH